MSTLTPEKLSAPLSGLFETSQDEDLEAMIARLDKNWGQLKELLRAQKHANLLEQPDCPISLTDLRQVAGEHDDLSETEGNSLLSASQARVDVTPQEAEAIVDGVEKLGEEARMLERLVRLERQNRGLIFYSVFCTLLFLGMLFSHFLLLESAAYPTEALQQDLIPQVSGTTTALNAPNLSCSDKKTLTPGI